MRAFFDKEGRLSTHSNVRRDAKRPVAPRSRRLPRNIHTPQRVDLDSRIDFSVDCPLLTLGLSQFSTFRVAKS